MSIQVEARPLVKHSVSMISVRSDDNPEEEREQIQEAEERAKGTLKWSVIAQYMKRVESWFVVFLTIVALLLTQTAGTISDYWLSFWYVSQESLHISLLMIYLINYYLF